MTSLHDKYADEYDNQIKLHNCSIAEVLFGLSYEFIKKGDFILDVGIGTGISSRLFYLAGLEISGIDSSEKMLDICEEKGIARELVIQDILVLPWPFNNSFFNHVICCGVFHFIGELDNLFEEISRVQKKDGVFAFTVMNCNNDNLIQKKYEKRFEDGLNIFSHKSSYIKKLMKNNHYQQEKEVVCYVEQTQFRVIVARKIGI